MMRTIGYKQLVSAVLMAAVVLGIAAGQSLVTARNQPPAGTFQSNMPRLNLPPAQSDDDVQVNGEYAGQVVLAGVYTGVYSDPHEPEAVDLGYIDLALALEQTDTNVSGHVMLTGTLVFTQERTIDGQGVGPLVSGSFDGTTLQLTSEQFAWVVSSGRTLDDGRTLPEQIATRQFNLVSTEVENEGARLVGSYRETIWGVQPQPVTVVGSFSLQRPVFPETEFPEPPPPQPSINYLPLIFKDSP